MKLEERGGRADDLGWWWILTETKNKIPSQASCIEGSNIQCPMQQLHDIHLTLFTSFNETSPQSIKCQADGFCFLTESFLMTRVKFVDIKLEVMQDKCFQS